MKKPPNYSKQAAKVINGLDKPTKQRIKKAITKIPKGDIKTLQGYSDGRKRLRVGKFRVIFLLEGEDLDIIDIGSRGDIYKGDD